MPEGRIDEIVNEPEVSKQLDQLYDRLFKVVTLIRTINSEGGKINLNRGLSESTIAAQQAKAATEELKKAKADLAKQEQAVKLAAQQAAAADAARSRALKLQADQDKAAAEQQIRDIKAVDQEATAAARRTKERDASIARQRKVDREAEAEARKRFAKIAKEEALGEAGSVNRLRKELNEARAAYYKLGEAARDASQGEALLKNIKALDEQVKKLEGNTGQFQKNVGNYPVASDVVGGVQSLLAIAGISAGAAAILEANSVASDQIGDLQRILGGTADEANELYKSLKNLDTRTSLEGLANIAIIAAKAGVAKEDIKGVTKAIDELVVVLGAELGDADQVTTSLVKIVNIFSKDGKVTGEALSSIGNAILELANAGVASGPFLVDYAQRLAGVAKAANFSLGSALGLAAGFEELGQTAEVAGTSTTTILSRIGADVPKYAKVAGKSIEEFTATLRDKPAEAILQVAEALVKGKKGFDDIASAAKSIEAKGQVASVLTTLGSNADKFREKIEMSGKALGDQGNIIDQFNIKNETLAATLDKLKNAIINLTTNPDSNLGNFFANIIKGATGAITLLDKLLGTINPSTITGSDKTAKGLDALRKPRNYTKENDPASLVVKVVTLGQIDVVDAPDLEKYGKALSKSIDDAKKSNDRYLDDFSKSTKKEQKVLLEGLLKTYETAKKTKEQFDAVSKAVKPGFTDPKNSADYLEVILNRQRAADALMRASRIVLDQSKPTAPVDNSIAEKQLTDKEKAKLAAKEKRENDARAKMREREIQAEMEANKFDLQVQIEAQKTIVDSEQSSLAEKLLANEEYYRLKDKLAEDDIAYQKKKVEQEVGVGKATRLQLATLDKKLEYDKAKNQKESGDNLYKILNDNADDQTKKLIAEGRKQQEFVEKAQNEELQKTQKYYTTGKINKEQYEAEKLRITNKYAILELDAELETQEQVLALMKQRGLPVEEQESKLAGIRNKIRALDLEYFTDTEKKKTDKEKEQARIREELRKKEIEGVKQLAKESVGAIFAIFDASFENQKNAIQDQIELLDKNTQKEIEAVDKSTDSAQNKADRIAVINARAAAQKEALERRQRQIDQEKARFDRLKSIGEIIANTAVNIVKVFPNPVLIALAAAIGGAQLGQVLATPIPRYKRGVINHPGGLAEINDGERMEVMESPTGKAYVSKNKNAIVDMPAQFRVHASLSDYYRNNASKSYTAIPTADKSVYELRSVTDQMARNHQKQTAQILQGLENNKTVVNVNNTWSGLTVTAQKTTGKIQYLDRNVFL